MTPANRLRRPAWLAPRAVLVGLLAGAAVACGPPVAPPAPAPRGIVLVTVESFRADALRLYGGEIPTPGLDRLAEAGTVFDDAATPCPGSRPGLAAILTGLAPDRAGVRDNHRDRLDPEIPALPGRMTAAGRRTLALVSSPFASHTAGFDAGFELFDGPEIEFGGPAAYYPKTTPASEVAGRLPEWLAGVEPGAECFAWLHLSDLHGVATSFADPGRVAEAYPEAVAAVDRAVEAVEAALDAAGLWDDTMVVVTGTHGEHLGEDGALGHAFWLDEATLRVPLIVKGAAASGRFAAGVRSANPVWLPDVAVTLAEAAGVPFDTDTDGVAVDDRAGLDTRVRMAWTWAPEDQHAWPTLTAVRTEAGWDVFEWDALREAATEDTPGAGDSLRRAAARPARPRARRVPDDVRAELERDGIIESWDEADVPEPEREERNELLRRVALARHTILGGGARFMDEQSAGLMKAGYGGDLAVRIHRQYQFVLRRAADRAETASRIALKGYPERPEVLHWAAHAALLNDEVDRAALRLVAAAASAGTDWELEYDLACARSLQGDQDRALEHLENSIDLGYRQWQHIESDGDLVGLRQHPGFAALMREHGR